MISWEKTDSLHASICITVLEIMNGRGSFSDQIFCLSKYFGCGRTICPNKNYSLNIKKALLIFSK